MSKDTPYKAVVRTMRYMSNPLMNRKQFMVEISHPQRPGLNKDEIRDQLMKMYKVSNRDLIIVFGLNTVFGGGMTKGYGMIYSDMQSLKAFEPRYRLARFGLAKKKERPGRQARKVLKNKAKYARGHRKTEILMAGKKR